MQNENIVIKDKDHNSVTFYWIHKQCFQLITWQLCLCFYYKDVIVNLSVAISMYIIIIYITDCKLDVNNQKRVNFTSKQVKKTSGSLICSQST